MSQAYSDPNRETRLGVDWWYRHASDEDQSLRKGAQMHSTAASTAAIETTAREMMAQGYSIQRVTLQPICPQCHSNGRIVVRKYKRTPSKYAECPTCGGNGFVGAVEEWPLT